MTWLLITIAVGLSGGDAGGTNKNDKDEIQDTWAIVALETDGMKREGGESAKNGSARVVITADTLTVRLPGGFGGELELEATYKIDSAKRPGGH